MILRRYLFRRATVIGVGLIGGSMGIAMKKKCIAREVIGFSHHQATLALAKKNQAVDVTCPDLKKAVENSDLVIFSTPVGIILDLLPKIAQYLKRGCIVTDVGSTKVSIVETGEKNLESSYFIGSHPLAGSEKRGVAFADGDLFEQTMCIVTPTENTSRVAKAKIKSLWNRLGAQVSFMTPAEHDEILAYISHLPHLLAYSLMDTIPTKYLAFASKGLKDTTRIASSSPQMWQDVCTSNSKSILKSLDGMVKVLSQLRKAILDNDQKKINGIFLNAKKKRDGLN